ncbi:hypothetical protein GLOIN_2v1724524 [Rhizophagus irregularis DAOM 181602=DAOM 197198]|nr:hypothetical protein GLOIN_2v1724524 [Rhizophagus irregularis DAOM 181602=DAOM 197198]GET61199.1 hypothetical protein GLOIN_2v1724524 [Rhizophagus irregularis DAOM 181602=DAOM 197198]GET61946.1 hypothetical protein GLOIN_2v1724524 [Rhizophagus irregularis DAOM 181602=DAOM 197198]
MVFIWSVGFLHFFIPYYFFIFCFHCYFYFLNFSFLFHSTSFFFVPFRSSLVSFTPFHSPCFISRMQMIRN